MINKALLDWNWKCSVMDKVTNTEYMQLNIFKTLGILYTITMLNTVKARVINENTNSIFFCLMLIAF